jgi:hypothetical protein
MDFMVVHLHFLKITADKELMPGEYSGAQTRTFRWAVGEFFASELGAFEGSPFVGRLQFRLTNSQNSLPHPARRLDGSAADFHLSFRSCVFGSYAVLDACAP